MTTILFYYMHRDEANYKDHLEAVIDNPNDLPLDEIERQIKACLIDREFLTPEKIGLAISGYADPGDWHEFSGIVALDDSPQNFIMTLDELLERLAALKRVRQVQHIKVHKVPAGIPLRLALSWLEFLRETRESIEIITSICKGKKAVVVFGDAEDWKLLSETLDMDARSANFERGLRKDIENALGRAVVLDVDPLTKLRRKLRQIEQRIKTAIRKAEA